MKGAWLVVLVSLAYAGVSRRAPACTPVKALTPEAVLSPLALSAVGVQDSLLFKTREPNPATITAGFEVSIPLELQAAFEPLRPFEPPLSFFKPARPLDAETFYVLDTQYEGMGVPFYVRDKSVRLAATLTVSVASRTVPEDVLSSASCYSGPLEDRPFTRVADVAVTARGSGDFLVSVTTLDSVSGELIEDVGLRGEDGARLELPLPDGVADCLRVQVFDYAGTLVVDEGSLCATPEGEERTVSTYLFMPTAAPPGGLDSDPGFVAPQPMDEPSAEAAGGAPSTEPGKVSRTSQGCELSYRRSGSESSLGVLLLSALLLARRRGDSGALPSGREW